MHKGNDISGHLLFQLTSINLSRLLLPEPGALRCNGVPLADSGVQKLGVEDWAWTVFRADLLYRGRFLSESEAKEAPDCEAPTSNHETESTISQISILQSGFTLDTFLYILFEGR